MIRKILAKCILGTALCCCSFLIALKPAQAFIWPTVDLGEITSFVNSINTGLQQIQSVKSQVDNAINTVKVVGDQVSSVMKYATDLKNTITNIKDQLQKVVNDIKEGIDSIGDAVKDLEDQLKGENDKNKETAGSTTDTIEDQIEAGGTEEEAQSTLDDAEKEISAQKDAINQAFDEAKTNIDTTLENSNKAIEMLVNGVDQNSDLSDEEKNKLKDQASEIQDDIDTLKSKASSIISNTKEDFNQKYSQQIAEAFSAYSQAISDYYSGKIDKEGLKAAGEEFKKAISEANTDIDDNVISDLVADAQKVADKISDLENNIMNSISNAKGYSDGSEEANNKILDEKIYAFSFTSDKETALFSAQYDDKGNFEISKELVCPEFNGMEKVEENPRGLRMCLEKAKGDIDTWGEIYSESLYKDYKKDGVYKHMVKDYNIANITGVSKVKQFSAAWGNLKPEGDEEKGTFLKLQDMLKNVSNTRDAFVSMGMIDIEAPKMWSQLRRMDALYRSKKAIQAYETEPVLYINESTDDDFYNATRSAPGTMESSMLDANESQSVIGKVVFSNVFLYLCDKNLGADKISVSTVKKGDTQAYNDAEQKLKECLYLYALNANRSTSGGGDAEAAKEEWRRKQKKAYTDSVFQNFAIAATNIYKSRLDNEEKSANSDEKSIISLQEGLTNSTTTKDDYAAGAQINYYTTQQILSIVDADAQEQQTEILRDLATFNYNYFDNVEETAGGE